jgi:hypothetical protein
MATMPALTDPGNWPQASMMRASSGSVVTVG